MRILRTVCALALFAGQGIGFCAAGATVESIRKAGALTCGIDLSEGEYSMTDEHGARVAFDSDLCQAVGTAILGRGAQIVVHGYPDDETAVAALRSGEVDLIPSLSDDFSYVSLSDIGLTQPVLYDGLGLMVPRSLKVASAAELKGKKICALSETETEVNLRAWFAQRHLDFISYPFQEEGEMEAAFVTENCSALAADRTRLAASRVGFGSIAKDYQILPEVLSKDPLAAAYRRSDAVFGAIVDLTIDILVQAEESGVTAGNLAGLVPSKDPVVERLLGKTRELGRPLGLEDAWPARVIAQVGNYGEIYERDLGAGSPLQLPRGQSALWTGGGMMQARPLK
jgi:general L-amino acid transport system substrate-binding protein